MSARSHSSGPALPKGFDEKLRAFAAADDNHHAARELVVTAVEMRDQLPLNGLTRGILAEVDLKPGASELVPIARTIRRLLGPSIGLGPGTT